MKKKLALVLSMLLLALGLTACGTKDQTNMEFNGVPYAQLQTDMSEYIECTYVLSSYTEQYVAMVGGELTDDSVYEAMEAFGITDDTYASDYGIVFNDVEKQAATKFIEVREKYGELTDLGDLNVTVTVSGNTTTVDYVLPLVNVEGATKDITFELVYKSWNMEITGLSIDPVQTLGEKMANAGLNTLISIVIVFMVLVLISLIIYAFNIFPYIEKKKKEKADRKAGQKVDTETVVETTAVATEEVLTDDYELVAVIAAAIAASEGCSTSDFVVRSINRR